VSASHAEFHPEPEEGCRDCVNTRRPFPFAGRAIADVLADARLRDDDGGVVIERS